MPYRLNPSNRREVQVKRGGEWKLLKRHKTVGEAKKHKAALDINVEH